MTEREVDVTLTPSTVACASHGEHLRAHFPAGFLVVGLSLFTAATEGRKLTRAVRKATKYPIGRPHPRLIDKVIRTTPLCYYVTRDEIRRAFTDADILVKQRCDLCGIVRLAGPYSYQAPELTTATVCIECMLDAGEREHKAYPKGRPRG